MKTKTLLAVATVALLAVLVPAFAAADVSSDVTQLSSDVATAHTTLLADFTAVTTDAQAGKRTALKADVTQLRSDTATLLPAIKADRQQLQTDIQAARAAHVTGLGKLVGSAIKADIAALKEIRQAGQEARAALQAFRASQHPKVSS